MSPSPTEQRPLSTVRVFHEPQFRRQQVQLPKADAALQHSALSPGVHNAPHSATAQARQDSAIDQHRFEAANDAQLSKSNVSYSHQSPKDSQLQPSPRLNSYQPAPSTLSYAPADAPHQSETLPSQAGAQHPARQHSKSLSSAAPYSAASPRPHEHSTERTVPLDMRNGADPKVNNAGPSSLPADFYSHQNTNGTRQQRYNVRFAANYTSENMPPSQKPRNDPPTPNTAPTAITEPEQPRSSPAPITSTEEPAASTNNGTIHQAELQPRSIRETRDRGDREPSVERCSGCNEAWTRPIPDLDSRHISPAETNEEFRQIASNMIERLRRQNKMADAAYDEWKWRHSHCVYRPASPYSTGSVDDSARRTEPIPHAEGSTNGTTDRKRKSEIPHELRSASKQQRVTGTSPAPAVRQPEASH